MQMDEEAKETLAEGRGPVGWSYIAVKLYVSSVTALFVVSGVGIFLALHANQQCSCVSEIIFQHVPCLALFFAVITMMVVGTWWYVMQCWQAFLDDKIKIFVSFL